MDWQTFLQLAQTGFSALRTAGGLASGFLETSTRVAEEPLRVVRDLEQQLGRVGEGFLRLTDQAQNFFATLIEGSIRATTVLMPLLRLIGETPWLGDFQFAASTLTNLFSALTLNVQNLSGAFQNFLSIAATGLRTVTTTVMVFTSSLTQAFQTVLNISSSVLNILRSINAFASTLGAIVFGLLARLIGTLLGSYLGVPWLGNVFGIIASALPSLAGLVSGVTGRLLQAFLGLFGQLGIIISQALSVILQMVSRLMEQILNTIRFAFMMLGRIFTEYLQTLSALWQMFGAVAARAETTAVALQVLARNAGISRREILALWEALSKQNISLIEGGNAMVMLMARFPQLGLLTGRLAEAAKDWAAAMGFVSSEVLRDFAVAVARGEISMLEHLNIVYASSTAWQLFAAQIGKSAQDLNALERSLAVADFLINQIGRSVKGMYEETFDTLGKLLTSFQRVFQEVQIVAGRELLGAYSAIGRTLYSILQVVKESEGIKTLFRAIGTGVLEGMQRVFGATTFPKDPEQNPVARALRAVLESPIFRQAAMQIGGVVAGLTEMFARGLLNILNNLPQILERLINFFRIIYAVLVGIAAAAQYVWRAILNWFAGLVGVGAQLATVQGITELIVRGLMKVGEVLAAAFMWLGNVLPTVLSKIADGLKLLGTLAGSLWEIFRQVSVLLISYILIPIGAFLYAIFAALSKIPGLGAAFKPVADALGAAVGSLITIGYALLTLAPSGQKISDSFQKIGDALKDMGAWIGENFPAYAQKAQNFFNGMAGAVGNAMNNAAQSTEALTRTTTYNFKQVEDQANRIITLFKVWATQAEILQQAVRNLRDYYNELYGTVEDIGALAFVNVIQAWRQVEAAFTNLIVLFTVLSDPARFRLIEPMMAEELYRDLAEALANWAKAVNEVFRTLSDIMRETDRLVEGSARLAQLWTFGASETLRLLELRRQLLATELQLLDYWASLPLGVQRRLDVTKQLVDTQTELLRLTQEELRLVVGLVEQFARVLTGISESMERLASQVFFAPLTAMEGFLLRLRATMMEIGANWVVIARALMVGDIPYEQYADALRRYNAAIAQAIETLVNALTRPLQQVTSLLDNQIRYWRAARDMVNSFNLGMYATLSVHMAEAQILVEKLRTLELIAQVNRYNADIYWRIRAEIINIKRELLDIARRPIFIFGLTREQIEASFRDFTRMIADPRFWLRWRLGGQMLPEMALRAAIWAQQPGMAAIPVFDPRLIAMLGLPQILAAFPMFRWWGLLEAVTGRRMPFDVRTLIQAAGMGLLADIFNVPQPLTGMPPLSYFFNLMPQIQNFLARFGMLPDIFMRPLSPFMPFRTGAPELVQPAVDQVGGLMRGIQVWLSQVLQQARTINYILTNMATLHGFYLPRIDSNLRSLLLAVAGARIGGMINLPPEAFRDPRAFVEYSRGVERGIAGLREGFTGGVPFPTRRQVYWWQYYYQVPAGYGYQVPVMMGNRPIGMLNLNPAALQEWMIRIALQLLEGMALGYPPFVPTQ